MQITRRTFLDSGIWQIGRVDVRDASAEPGDEEVQATNVLVLPVAGVFAKHEGSRSRVVGTPNDAVLIRAERPYRLSYPAGIGDRCLTIRFSDDVASEVGATAHLERAESSAAPLLPAPAMAARNVLWRRFHTGDWDPIEVEELSGWLVEQALPVRGAHDRDAQPSEHRAAIEAVKEAVSADPAHPWTLGELGRAASVSPYHLSRMFRRALGTSIYRYVVRARLAMALELLVESEHELTAVGLASGFSSHSHFAARFRAFFGVTPSAFRRAAARGAAEDLRRIVTATAN